ncbi:MAG: 4-hydroxy-tetrahydrodipicolinate reductase [Clostridiales bacterium]|jgi:4-hydroxy-tetrahydrodipicolinate reductase|nr:4-hydroxy-tetrahydrodipicolinate reductase [Clostridiales bacterium]
MKLIITAPRGKMASLIVADAASRDNVEIVAGVGPAGRDYIGRDIGEVAMIGCSVGAPVVDDLESVIDQADVVCDFSTVELGMEVLDACIRHHKALVIGTTGFSPEQRAKLEEASKTIPIMIAANTDRMVNVMRKLLMDAAKELYEDTDIEIIDMHDNTKLDAPSGTARELIESMGEAVGRDLVSDAVYGRPLGRHPREKGKVTFHALRGGDTPSSHTVFFFGEGERLEITHHCLNWKGCAKGAVNACIWMADQPVGLYGIRESMGL